ncbi:MAG: 2'-5' RNA ligase [Candidatus Cloacimonetes bacterium 4572_65]|nr:MAG: 2'-5' RNA ligase [Candidatus Cloacimonetes bacterium 4572_65]
MRFFYGFSLSQDIKSELNEKIEFYKTLIPHEVTWVSEENLHITFQFIGTIKREDMDSVQTIFDEMAEKIKQQRFAIKGIEVFPPKSPKLIWISLTQKDRVVAQYLKTFQKNLKKYGIKIGVQDFRPHITLGRIKTELSTYQIGRIERDRTTFNYIKCNEIALFESNLYENGPIYSVLKTYNLQ